MAWVTAHLPFHVALLGLAVGLSLAVVGSDLLNDSASVAALLTGPAALVAVSLAVMAGSQTTIACRSRRQRRGPHRSRGGRLDRGFSVHPTTIVIAVVWLGFTLAASPRSSSRPRTLSALVPARYAPVRGPQPEATDCAQHPRLDTSSCNSSRAASGRQPDVVVATHRTDQSCLGRAFG